MVCQACGSPAQGTFCSHCGAPISAAPVYAPPAGYPYAAPGQRVARHVQTLGILWCVFGAFRALTGVLGALLLGGFLRSGSMGGWGSPHVFPFMQSAWLAGFTALFAVITAVVTAACFLTGFALLTRKRWGRVLAIVMGVLELIHIPFGTGLGIYTLWVLAPTLSGAEYEALAAQG